MDTVECIEVNGTPVFAAPGTLGGPLARAWGAGYAGGRWLVPAYYPMGLWAARDVVALAPDLRWSPQAEAQRRALAADDASWAEVEARWARREDPLPDVPSTFFPRDFQPYLHQRYGIAQLLLWWRRWLLWKMGTGKTRTVLDAARLLAERGAFQRMLVVGPPVVLDGWVEETARCTRGAWTAVRLDGTPRAWAAAQAAPVVLASYARARLAALETVDVGLGSQTVFAPERSPLASLGYDVLVVDEAHSLGNWEGEQTQAVIALAARAPRRVLLTGTPGDDPRKLYAQLYALAPGLVGGSYATYEARHVVYAAIRGKRTHVVAGFRHLGEVNARVDAVASRMRKEDCLDLPPLTEVDVHFELGPRQLARYNEIVTDLRVSVAPLLEPRDTSDELPALRIPHGAARVNKLLQIVSGFVLLGGEGTKLCDGCPRMEACVTESVRPYTRRCPVAPKAPPRRVLRDVENPKLDVFRELAGWIFDEDPTNKLITWGNFIEELDDIERIYADLGVASVRLDGKTTSHAGAIRERFQGDPACRALVGMESAGIGINLPAANYMCFYSLSWEPTEYAQALDRYNRPGQTRPMTAYRLLSSPATPALDRSVASLLRFKDAVTYTMVERVTCATCPRQAACALDGTRPFRENCTYAGAARRPLTRVEVL